ncbi:MAG TPA: phage tail protein [Gammaproteobacteria bacterium]
MPEAEKQSATVARLEPLRNYNFIVDLGAGDRVLFTECYGLGARVTPIRFCSGGAGETVRYLTGRVDYNEATFRYGVTQSASVLWDWFEEAKRGVVKRREVSVVMLQPDGVTPEFNINLSGAWITQLTAPSLHAAGTEAAIEEIKLIYEGISRDASSRS